MERTAFPEEVAKSLKYYVYRLIDPRTGHTFYVGKGRGNRVFDHALGNDPSIEDEDIENPKLLQIRRIINAGFSVAHVIHRHGLTEEGALEVESALIDAYPGLDNRQAGQGSDRGTMHSEEIIRSYQAEEADFQHKLILININRYEDDEELYDAVRYAWKISVSKAQQADYVLAVRRGIILDAFIVDEWLPANKKHFPDLPEVPGRYGFRGRLAEEAIRDHYRMKRVPDEYRKRGSANPIRYARF